MSLKTNMRVGVTTLMVAMGMLLTKITKTPATRENMASLVTQDMEMMIIMATLVKMDPKEDSQEEDTILGLMIDTMAKTIEVVTKDVPEETALVTLEMKTLTRSLKCTSLDLTKRLVLMTFDMNLKDLVRLNTSI